MAAYYNEIDPYAAQWLRNLIAAGHIAPGEVDERSIVDVRASDLRGFTQCHFFAGIGVWSYSLRLAGWADDRPVWTGSCPCPPFSSAAHGRLLRRLDDRHLWPVWRRLIAQCAPATVFGEQVAHAGDWLDEVCNDMECLGYSVGASIFPALSVGFSHIRSRLYLVCNADRQSEPKLPVDEKVAWMSSRRRKPSLLESFNGTAQRVAVMRAIGNSLCSPQAAEFVRAYLEA